MIIIMVDSFVLKIIFVLVFLCERNYKLRVFSVSVSF